MHFFMTGVGDQDVASTPLAQKWRVRTEIKENIITFQKPYIFSAFMSGGYPTRCWQLFRYLALLIYYFIYLFFVILNFYYLDSVGGPDSAVPPPPSQQLSSRHCRQHSCRRYLHTVDKIQNFVNINTVHA